MILAPLEIYDKINNKTDLDSAVLGDLIRDGNGLRQGVRMMVITTL